MALIEQNVTVTTKYGRMPAFAACPDEPGSFPGIIFYMDAPGFRDELCNMARRIAKQGYFCILPDMYYRLGTIRFDLPRRTDAMGAVVMASMAHLTNGDVVDDTAGILGFLDAQDKCAPGPVGCVGHCMSGQYITTVAAKFPNRFAAAASMYGVKIVTEEEDSPHKLLDQVQGELFYAFAERDAHEVQIFPDTDHGFQFAERAVYAPVAAEEAWDKLFALWERRLK